MNLNPLGPNCTELDLCDGTRVLFSYRTPVAYARDGEYFRTSRKWSLTTTRHINLWLDGRDAAVVPQAQIDDLVSA